MKSKYSIFNFVIATMVGCLLPVMALAGSIQVLPASSSKIKVIGTKKNPSIASMGLKNVAKAKPAITKNPQKKPELKVVKAAPAIPTMPKMRTGEVELPVIQVNQSEGN